MKNRTLADWMFILLQTGLFMAILMGFTAATQGFDLKWEEWAGLPILVVFVVSLLGVLLLDDHFRK